MRSRKPWLWAIPAVAAIAAIAVVAAIALQPHAPTEPVNDFSQWRQVSKIEVGSQTVQVTPDAVISWDHGFLMTAGIGQASHGGVLTSTDGLHWTASYPPSLKPTTGILEIAAYGSTAYLIGIDNSSPDGSAGTTPPVFYDVWTSTNGTTWTKVADRLTFINNLVHLVGFAAGPQGIALLIYGNLEDSQGFYDIPTTDVTVSKDGRTWTQPAAIPMKTDFEPSSSNMLTANPSGFTITGSRSSSVPGAGYDVNQGLYLTSPDGTHWTDSSTTFPSADELRVMADGTSGTTICGNESVPAGSPLFGMGDADGALTCWYRQHGATAWQSHLPQAGQLPDVGAAALGDQEILALSAAQNNFIAVGTSITGQTAQVGAIWVSPDGTTWKKLPTAASGLTHYLQLTSVAEYDGTAIATGFAVTGNGPTSYEISTPHIP